MKTVEVYRVWQNKSSFSRLLFFHKEFSSDCRSKRLFCWSITLHFYTTKLDHTCMIFKLNALQLLTNWPKLKLIHLIWDYDHNCYYEIRTCGCGIKDFQFRYNGLISDWNIRSDKNKNNMKYLSKKNRIIWNMIGIIVYNSAIWCKSKRGCFMFLKE